MPATVIGDLVLPSSWADYVNANSTESTALWTSGVVQTVPGLQIPNGGRAINVPFLNDLSGDAETMSGTQGLTVNNVTAGVQVGPVNYRAKAYGVNDLAPLLSGADPAGRIADRFAAFWSRSLQRHLLAILQGAFGVSALSANVLNIGTISGASGVLSTSAFIDAEYLLGDARSNIAAIVCNSATKAALEKLDQGTNFRASETLVGNTYRGKEVIEIDTLAPQGSIHTVYMMAPGAIGFVEQPMPNAVETDRDGLTHNTNLINRRGYVMHPMGLSFTGALGGDSTPENSAFSTSGNWSLVVDRKLVQMTAFRFRLA